MSDLDFNFQKIIQKFDDNIMKMNLVISGLNFIKLQHAMKLGIDGEILK